MTNMYPHDLEPITCITCTTTLNEFKHPEALYIEDDKGFCSADCHAQYLEWRLKQCRIKGYLD